MVNLAEIKLAIRATTYAHYAYLVFYNVVIFHATDPFSKD